MCGIFGFLSAQCAADAAPGDEFFRTVDQLTEFTAKAVEALGDGERQSWLEKAQQTQKATYSWMERAAFLTALTDSALAERLRRAARQVAEWSGRLEAFSTEARLSRQRDWEFVNQLIIAGKDIAWQLEVDLLGNFESVRGVLQNADEASRESLGHAWQLNVFLSSLNRLEVRGRDSAGLAAYLRFPNRDTLEQLLDTQVEGTTYREWLTERSRSTELVHGTLLRPASHDTTLLAVFKTAREVGKMGDNVAFLREAITSDRLFQAALQIPGVDLQCLAHTRWASNGVISLANAHPVDSALRCVADDTYTGRGEILAALNGDVDNFLELKERYVDSQGFVLDETITTDAKIIPIVVAHHYRETGDLSVAFRRALDEFEGSMAIAVIAADLPGQVLCAQKGSGQGLFLGDTRAAVAIASEMYGVVEFTPRYVKAEGEFADGGEAFRLTTDRGRVTIELLDERNGPHEIPESRIRTAEITTRDINRGDKPHFFLKEINESVASVTKTLRGKFLVEDNEVTFLTGSEVLSPELVHSLASGKIRHIFVVGQGTAAIAGESVAHLLRVSLRGVAKPLQIQAMKATELSAHHLAPEMSDCLLIAVSQSGTTTDTNRTVDLARERGAWVLGIVNRRNSDLVYKSHGVLYTSDGRDIEMSVASTKAFYSQCVAGQVLALSLAAELGTLKTDQLLREVENLQALPAALDRVLALEPEVRKLAREFALTRKYWAITGSGPGKIAANEIRIKLSELCYKSIAVDFLEDKKHIDLSCEPLILICTNSIPEDTVSDAVKEVAIFKAHNSIPLVITDENETRFDPYAAGTIKVPSTGGPLDYLLATMVGHLFGYHAAAAFDHHAEKLRELRAALVETTFAPDGNPAHDAGTDRGSLTERLESTTVESVVAFESFLLSGQLESALNASTAARLTAVFNLLLGRTPLDAFSRQYSEPVSAVLNTLGEAIGELSRPIDAIKHQAKTVTVGISRSDQSRQRGPLWSTFHKLGLALDRMEETHRRFLTLFEDLVTDISGATLYAIKGLDPLGRPTPESTIHTVRKEGGTNSMLSRCEDAVPLSGTKWAAVKRREIFLGRGITDGKNILVLPVVGESEQGSLLLYHVDIVDNSQHEARLPALEAVGNRLEELKVAITESNLEWTPALLNNISNEELFFDSTEHIAEKILERHAHSNV
jgi:glucosamine--fructose-6-phosphate aminotransferase (isomerizing)